MQKPTDVTEILVEWTDGDPEALNRLIPLVYHRLKQPAHARLQQERRDHTLNTTALVHEAYVRLVKVDQIRWTDRAHFFALASRLMRQLLVDYGKRRRALKRGGGYTHVPVEEDLLTQDEDADRVVELDEHLLELEKDYPRQARVIEHKFFGGLTIAEIAAVLEVSHATVERDLRFARTWLANRIAVESVGQ